MEWSWKGQSRSTRNAAALYLLTALILSSLSVRLTGGPFVGLRSGWISANNILGESSPILFLCASLFTFLRRRHGPVWVLLAGLFAVAWLDSLDQEGWSPWVYLNYFVTGDEDLSGPEKGRTNHGEHQRCCHHQNDGKHGLQQQHRYPSSRRSLTKQWSHIDL